MLPHSVASAERNQMNISKRILTVQDISCVGQCSLTVALPILSACGVETAIIPSAVLSTHTGNWTGFTFRDLTDDIPGISKHWQDNAIDFDAIYTGYIGNARQFDMIDEISAHLLKDGAPLIVDPAMADNGKLYYGFDEEFVKRMRKFVSNADYVLPNITEASFLTGLPYKEEYDEKYILDICRELHNIGAKNVILTGVSYSPDKLGMCWSDGKELRYHFEPRLGFRCHGTGDIFASVFTGRLVSGKSPLEAGADACRFVCDAMLNTPKEHKYGASFEGVLYKLGK